MSHTDNTPSIMPLIRRTLLTSLYDLESQMLADLKGFGPDEVLEEDIETVRKEIKRVRRTYQ